MVGNFSGGLSVHYLEEKNGNFLMKAACRMDSVLIIRKCRKEDIDGILRLQKELDLEDASPHYIPASRGELSARLSGYFMVAESGGEILGYVYGREHENHDLAQIPKDQPYLEIQLIYVNPEERNRNIGGRLLEGLMERAKEEGINRFVFSAEIKETESFIRFLKTHRFKPLKIEFYR